MPRRALFILAFFCLAGPLSATDWDDVVTDLRSVADDLTENQRRIEALKAQIAALQSLGQASADEILRLQTLVDEHAARIRDLTNKYTNTLFLAQKLKDDADRAAALTYIFGGTAAVAVLVALGEGFALAHR